MKRAKTIIVNPAPKKSKTQLVVAVPRNVFSKKSPFLKGRTTGFPRTMTMKHRYADAFNLAWTAGNVTTQIFSANGLFDPDITGSGHQPLYFDQMTAIYNHYTVVASKITVRTCANGAANAQLSLYLDDDATPTAASTARQEQNGAVTTLQAPLTETRFLGQKYSARANFGGDPVSDPNQQGTSSANPTEQMYFVLTAGGVSTGAANVDIQVLIEYTAVWQELRNIGSS